MDLVRKAINLAGDPKSARWLAPLFVLFETALCTAIIWKIPYTEIDWTTYMQHIELFIAGERDYVKLTGDTGPLVYPGAHVWIYRALYAVTDSGRDIRTAQAVFAGLYILTVWLVMQCYRRAGAPPYLYVLLVLSKRVHSIYVLRLFNDCFAVVFLYLAIYCYQRRFWTLGSFAFSLGVGVKMSVLLALPAIGVLLWQAMGLERAFQQAVLMGQAQVIVAYPFIMGHYWSYLSRAFEFTRQFLFKWTVNWRFVGEEMFLSRGFSTGLLAAHLGLLISFLSGRWLHVSVGQAIDEIAQPPSKEKQAQLSRRVDPDAVMTTILTAVMIGCLCARSLHYQFYVYIFWATPFLLWRSGINPALIVVLCGAQEWAWNQYPSTDISSMVAVACLFTTVAALWIGLGRRPTNNAVRIHAHSE